MITAFSRWLSPGRPGPGERGANGTLAMRSDLELGMVTWALRHMKFCIQHRLVELDLSLPEATTQFLNTMICNDRVMVESLGREVRHSGCAEKYVECLKEIGENYTQWVYRKTANDWKELEHTVVAGEQDEDKRYEMAPVWTGDSCAADCAMVLANFMKAGRIRGDAISLRRLVSLRLPAFALRYIMSQSLGTFTQKQWDDMRNYIMTIMNMFDPSLYPIPLVRYHPFSSMFQELLRDLPQVTWNEVTSFTCCDGQVATRTTQARSKNCLHVDLTKNDRDVLQDVVNAWIGQREDVAGDFRCTRGSRCVQKAVRRRHTILGRMPPRLMICLAPVVHVRSCQRKGVFRDLKIKYRTMDGSLAITYELVGATYVVGTNHFVCRWKRGDKDYVHYNSGRFSTQRSLDSECDGYSMDTLIFEVKKTSTLF